MKITQRREAGPDHVVLTIEGGRASSYRRKPCATCPWRVDAVGLFPSDAFRHSAGVAYDASMRVFACHESGAKAPTTCAGFLLRNAANNLAVRIKTAVGQIKPDQLHDGGAVLFDSYREMAVANGVEPDDPVLGPCRADTE